MNVGWCATAIIVLSATAISQDLGLELSLSSQVLTQEVASSIVLPVKCDLDRNLLVRVHREEVGGGSPVLRISPDGKTLTSILLPASEHSTGRIIDFAPGSNGEVLVLTEDSERLSYLARFDRDGKLQSIRPLESNVRARQLAVMQSGDVLVAGTDPTKTNVEQTGESNAVLSLFNVQGQLIKNLRLSRDLKPNRVGSGKIDRQYRDAIAASTLETSDDGRVYLKRFSPRGPVYYITTGGKVGRPIDVSPPEGALLAHIKVAHQTLVAEFIRKKPGSEQIDTVFFHVIDLKSKRIMRRYWHSNFRIGSAFGCYVPGNFTFLVLNDQRHLQIVNAIAP